MLWHGFRPLKLGLRGSGILRRRARRGLGFIVEGRGKVNREEETDCFPALTVWRGYFFDSSRGLLLRGM